MDNLTVLKYVVITLVLVVLGFINVSGQSQEEQDSLIQISGSVLDGTSEELLPLPLTNVYTKEDTRRGVSTDSKGFFTLIVEKGATIIFSAIGYREVEFVVPDTLLENRYFIVQKMSQDTINLPEMVVYPWPSKEDFKREFLAMDVTTDLERRASKNIAHIQEILEEQKSTIADSGNKTPGYTLRQKAKKNGQSQPKKIFDPTAWGNFFKSFKGIFKKNKGKKYTIF